MIISRLFQVIWGLLFTLSGIGTIMFAFNHLTLIGSETGGVLALGSAVATRGGLQDTLFFGFMYYICTADIRGKQHRALLEKILQNQARVMGYGASPPSQKRSG